MLRASRPGDDRSTWRTRCLQGRVLLEHAAERLHQPPHVFRSLQLSGACRKLLDALRLRVLEDGKPRLVGAERLHLKRHRRGRCRIAGTRFEGPEFEGGLVDLRQRERPKRLGGCRQDWRGGLHLLDPGPAAIATRGGNDALPPAGEPFEQDHAVGLGDGARENGVLVAGFGTAEIDVEDDGAGVLRDQALDQARMHRARPVMR